MADEKQQDPTPEDKAELDAILDKANDDDTDDAPKAQPAKKRKTAAKAEVKKSPKVKPKPKAATPAVYRGDRVKIDGDEFIVRAVHGAGRISLEGDEHPYTFWSPDEYEITRGKADREREEKAGDDA